MMKTFLSLLIGFTFTWGVEAQTPTEQPMEPRERAREITDMMMEELSLSMLQEKAFYKATLRMFLALEKEERPSQEIKEEYYESLEKVLTEEQYDLYIESQQGPYR